MGGFGSGRESGGGKALVEQRLALNVLELARAGLLWPGSRSTWQWTLTSSLGDTSTSSIGVETGLGTLAPGDGSRRYPAAVTLTYQANGEPKRYPVELEWTAPTYGGRRPWWRCPVVGCGRRCAVLYGGSVFACRRCHRLAYKTQRLAPSERAERKAARLRERLGLKQGAELVKPPGMHWRTFERLADQVEAADAASLEGFMAGASKLTEQLEARQGRRR